MTGILRQVRHFIEGVKGFSASGIDAGLRKQPAPDLALIAADRPCAAAGVFTTNLVRAAPVIVDEARLRANPDRIRAILINAAFANACTGEPGLYKAEQTAIWTAQALNCRPEEVLVMSTGVIGVQLPIEKIQSGIPVAVSELRSDGWSSASRAIMTTDTKPKRASYEIDGINVSGIAKGSGMISPNMATMLAVIATDANVPVVLLQKALHEAVDRSFNRIVVDGDMSTNDSVVVMASGAGDVTVAENDGTLASLTIGLSAVCMTLARQIVYDGEGATKFISIRVTGSRSIEEARQIGRTIASSTLVKTAFYGGDANWGRILAAAGRAGVELNSKKLALWYDDLQLVLDGSPVNYDEARANAIAGQPEITIKLDLGMGLQEATVWTCDLTHEYVDINGHYRT
jgi:glutamate N-acetyltransferase / amino-acid N-acetyltransferase